MSTQHTQTSHQAKGQYTTLTAKRRHGHAHRLVNTREMDRETWLSIRQSGIGSSDAAAAVGAEPVQIPAGAVDGENRTAEYGTGRRGPAID